MWQPIETCPKDGSTVDLWMVNEDGAGWRETNAYWVTDRYDNEYEFAGGLMRARECKRSGWFAPGHDYDGMDGFADQPRWFNAHPRQQKWQGRSPTHWMHLPPTPERLQGEG